MSPYQFTFSMVVQIAGVVATVVLALAALWIWRRPRLTLSLCHPEGDPVDRETSRPGRYYHLDVTNGSRVLAGLY